LGRTLTPFAAALLLVACGGGGDASSSSSPADAVPNDASPRSPVVFSGVAATGAALAGASLRIFGADGGEACNTTTDSAGAYSCSLASASRAPFTVVARLGDQALFSSAAVATSSTVNVTPLTTLIVARLSPSGNPERIVAEIAADPTLVTPARLDTRVAEVAAMIAPLTAAAGDSLHPISGAFAANGRGHDKVLDSLQINIRPDTNGASVQITIKVTPASDEAAPLQISFKSEDATPPAPRVTIRPEDLVQDGIASLVSNFLERMTACYALPLAQRISSVAPGATSATGDATRIQAGECRGLFVDNNPGVYKDSGRVVASDGHFPGLYRESSTGAAFDGGNFEYRFANGDVFMTFRSTSTNGVVGHSSLVLRAQNGQLKAIGNRHEYEAYIRPIAVDREFPLQPQYSYFGTGYNMSVANRVDPVTGNPVFAKAIVTTPAGSQLTLKPVAGRSSMVIEQAGGVLSGTGVEFFAAAYKGASTAGNPALKDSTLVFSSTQRSDDELRAIPDQGVWSVEWVHADTAVPNVRQTYRTTGRAPTLGEIRQMKFAQFSSGLRAAWMARTDVQEFRGLTFGVPNLESPTFIDVAAPDGSDGWVVPEGAQFPLTLSAFGRAADNSRFNDSTNVVSTARSGRIDCSKQSNADTHCDLTAGSAQFAAGGRVWVMELYGRTLRQLELVKAVALYRLAD
jgi:hypothetical protein